MILIIAVVLITVLLGVKLYEKVKTRTLTDEDLDSFKKWLVYACAIAQKEIGKDTGELKLYKVYYMATEAFPIIVKYLSFEKFSEWVAGAKKELLKMCDDNENIREFLYGMVEEAETLTDGE